MKRLQTSSVGGITVILAKIYELFQGVTISGLAASFNDMLVSDILFILVQLIVGIWLIRHDENTHKLTKSDIYKFAKKHGWIKK